MKIWIAIFVALLLIAIGSWGAGFSNRQQLREASNVFSLLGVVGSVVLAWLGKSPIKLFLSPGHTSELDVLH